jgi:hypothetical protein
LVLLPAWAVHLPVYFDAKNRGFDEEFVGQYAAWVRSLATAAHLPVGRKAPPKTIAHTSSGDDNMTGTAEGPQHAWSRDILRRKAWRDLFEAKDSNARALTVLTYAPLLTLVPLSLWALMAYLRRARRTVSSAECQLYPANEALAALVLLGGALTTFPQFFFFRPDAPHLSEFSPAFWVALVSGTILLGVRQHWRAGRRWPTYLLSVFITLHAALYLWRMLPDRWTGTIAARNGRTRFFEAENGVRVFLTRKEHAGLTEILQLIRKHSSPGDYLVAYPYHPSFNVLANRPTYEKNVYIDNHTRTIHWDTEAIARIERFRPAIIILSDWDINGTESSRFSVWGQRTKTWIETHYVYQGTYLDWYEIYVLNPQS